MVGSMRYGKRVPFAKLLTDQPTGDKANLQTVPFYDVNFILRLTDANAGAKAGH